MDPSYRHEALPTPGPAHFGSSCAFVVQDCLEHDERVMVLAEQTKLDDVRQVLDDAADDVTFVPTDEHGRNPSRIATLLCSFQAEADGRRSTGINETAFLGRSRASRDEARFSDFVLNSPALQTWPLSIVCLYDTESLDSDLLLAMRQAHAVIRGRDAQPNPHYLPDIAAAMYAAPFEPPPESASRTTVRPGQLAMMRSFVRATADDLLISPDRADDLVLAANEIVTNSLRHGGGRADLAMWFEDGALVCEVSDRGHIVDPMIGRLAPPPSATGGRGLWLANLLCDLLQIRSSTRGTAVRMHVDR